MSLYHTYRPQTFGDIVGQDHVKRTLQNAVREGKVAHAYLFSGSRGIGKTSMARILAMAVNCQRPRDQETKRSGKKKPISNLRSPISEPCGTCSSCTEIRRGANLNVVEIDAASNRGIDEIRALREAVGFAPSTPFGTSPDQQLRKVYIIDEVHMLTKEAFNALLKTLEEPPAHALFILATTELHRVPDTIISRTQHFAFKRATMADITAHLGRIALAENLQLEPEATALVALHADGAFRDALSLLDQLAALGESPITAEHVRLLLGIAPEAELLDLLGASFAGQAAVVVERLDAFTQAGYDPGALADALITALRQVLWAHYGVQVEGSEIATRFAAAEGTQHAASEIVAAIERLIIAKQQLRWSPLPLLPLELALLPERVSSIEYPVSGMSPRVESPNPPRTTETKIMNNQSTATKPAHVKPTKAVETPKEEILNTEYSIPNTQPSPTAQSTKNLPGIWNAVIEVVRQKNASLAALLRSSSLIGLQEGIATVQVPFSFYADRMKDRKNLPVILDALKAIAGSEYRLVCAVAGASVSQYPVSSIQYPDTKPVRSQAEVTKDVLEVFGATEPAEVTNG